MAKAIVYIHNCEVIHSDMRPENFLLHQSDPECPNFLLCDFGGERSVMISVWTESTCPMALLTIRLKRNAPVALTYSASVLCSTQY